MSKYRTARAVAYLIALNALEYGKEREREITQYRFSAATLRRLAERARIREAFLIELEDELRRLGWLLVWSSEIEFGVFRVTKLEGWPKLSSKRVNMYAELFSEDDLEGLYKRLAGEAIDQSEEDGDL